MKALIFRHMKACQKNLKFGLIISLGIFAFTFLIYLSTVCGNLKETGFTESEVFPYLIISFVALTALTPVISDLAGQSLKKDSDSGFDKFMLASPISVSKDVLSLYFSIALITACFVILSEVYVTVFVCMGVLPADPACFVFILFIGIFDVFYIAVQIPLSYAKINSPVFIVIGIAAAQIIGVAVSLLAPEGTSSDPFTTFRSLVAAAPILWFFMPVIIPVMLFGISFILSIKFRKGRVYNS